MPFVILSPYLILPPEKPALVRAGDMRGIPSVTQMRERLKSHASFPFPTFAPFGAAVTVFPQVRSTNTDFDSDTSATSHTINLPSSYSAGDLLLVFVCTQLNATGSIDTPAGWTQSFQNNNGASQQRQAMFYKVATGGEGSTVGFTLTATSRLISISYAIETGTYTGSPESASTGDSGASTSPDPPNVAPTWGSRKTLWIVTTAQGPTNPATGLPSGFGNQIDAILSGASRPTISSARRELEASSLDPSAFTIDSSRWIVSTVAIQGAG